MNYAELTYFDGAHFAHIAARDEAARLARKLEAGRAAYRAAERRTSRR